MKAVFLLIATLGITLAGLEPTTAQDRGGRLGPTRGPHTLYGDFEVDEGNDPSRKPLTYEIVLYNLDGTVVGRQFVGAKGRYRFLELENGQYNLVVLVENQEIGRTRVEIVGMLKNDFRQDLFLAWRPASGTPAKPGTISAADSYKRSASTEKLFSKAKEATDQKRHDEAIIVFIELLKIDPNDFQAWSELGTAYLLKESYDESEKAYVRSIAERPSFFLALMNLGRLRLLRKNFEGAIEPLTEAVKIQPESAEANYYLGEAYLQIKKGSKAVPYLDEAARLGKAEAHLRLATLYNAAGLKDKAADEYEQFLKKRPDYKDRKTLEQYISENKKH